MRVSPPSSPPEVVSHVWLLKAISITVVAALICAYLTLCLLFYQGQWQLVLHPHRAAVEHLQASLIHFSPDESAIPRLAGRWLAAAPEGRFADTTILFLPSGDGSVADSNSTLDRLHNLGINVFAFDYRGYGFSSDTHPTQQKMTQDADSAWAYLNTSRGTPAKRIVPYGTGVGASLATHLAVLHPDIPALLLESPKGDLLADVLHDPRASLLPARLLFHERFPLARPLASLRTPKLLIARSASTESAFRTAADPKMTVDLTSDSETLYSQALTRFLDQYVEPARQVSPNEHLPTPAPSTTILH